MNCLALDMALDLGVRVRCARVLREDYDYDWERVRVWLGVI